MTPDNRDRMPTEHEEAPQPDPDEYEPSGDRPWSSTGAEDPEEVASGDRPVGGVDDPGSVPSGESEQDLAAGDLGADPVETEAFPDDEDES